MLPNAHDVRHRRHKEPQRIRTGPRMMVACIHCKERKLKCDNNVPACANCCRFHLTCLVEDPITKRHQPRNYLETLEARVAHLEQLLRDTRPETAHDHYVVPMDDDNHRPDRSPLGSTPALSSTAASASISSGGGSLPSPGSRPLVPGGTSRSATADANDLSYASDPSDPSDPGDPDDTNDLAAKVGMLDLNAAGIEPHYLGASSAFAFSRAIGSSLLFRDPKQRATPNGPGNGTQYPGHAHGDLSSSSSGAAAGSGGSSGSSSGFLPCPLPPYEDGVVLSNAYFQNIHIQYPFLHEPTFRMWEAQTASPLLASTSSDPDVALFFVYAVYAVGALLLPERGHCHKQLYLSAQLYIDSILQRDNLQSVQAILACAVYSLRSPAGPSLWKLTGYALRQCTELGYHRDAKRLGSAVNGLQLELRKRAFWCAFAIDCSIAILLGRPLGLSLQEIDVELPKDMDDWALLAGDVAGSDGGCGSFAPMAPPAPPAPPPPPSSMAVAIHVFRQRCLWAKMYAALFSDTKRVPATDTAYTARIRQLRVELDAWRATAPPDVPRLSGTALTLFGSKDWYEVNYSHSILLLHRNRLLETRGGASAAPDHIVLECLDAAENISRGYHRQFVTGRVGYTWGALHFLFLAGLTYLHCLWTAPTARRSRPWDTVSNTCMDCSMVFVVMAERWGGAAPYRDIFGSLSRRTISMMMADQDPLQSAWPASFETSALAECGNLEDPWEAMQWISHARE
ncbi:Transcription factor [Niveomyces insectorum RCEF 264]|uniref:Transcription factor n=1 Tax=Niveomyces insectorum RCEF 264 TaxID=1081102 RepID=A0A162MCC2_9HYPO|nr:Transcription factor [Niveomyces insectorum RCEF 264]